MAEANTEELSLDGVDLGPLLFRNESLPERTLFWPVGSRAAARAGPWKTVRNKPGMVEQYNLDDDIGERSNLAGQRPELVEMLQQAWFRWGTDVDNRAEAYHN